MGRDTNPLVWRDRRTREAYKPPDKYGITPGAPKFAMISNT